MLCIQANVNQAPDPGFIKYKKYCKDLCLNNIAKLSPSKASASASVDISCYFLFFPPPPTPGKYQNSIFLLYICIPQWKTTSMENELNGRQPQRKMTSMEDVLNGRLPQ